MSTVFLILGFALIILLFLIGAPIWVAMSSGAAVLVLGYLGNASTTIPTVLWGGIDTFTFMAVPFFMMAGNIMAKGGCAPYLFKFMNAWVGKFKGGLPIAVILTCAVFAAVTGSTLATLSAVSVICLPMMRKAGYSDKFTAGLIATASTLGQVIPPSIIMIQYGALTSTNAGTLFKCGMIPGFIMAAGMMVVAVIRSPKPSELVAFNPADYTWKSRGIAFKQAIPALLMPVIVLGGIYGGITTPTEAAAISCIYGLIVCVFVYKEMDFKGLKEAVGASARSTGGIFLVCGCAMIVSLPLTYMQIPQKLAMVVAEAGLNATQLTLMVSLIFLILGCFLDTTSIIYMVIPIVLPALNAAGVDLYMFCIVTVICMLIGLLTPPFGMSLYMTSSICNVKIGDILKQGFPYILVIIAVLLLIIFVPEVATILR